MRPPDDAWAFGQEVAAVLRPILADDFVGAWFVGSIARGGYVRGESDIDIAGRAWRFAVEVVLGSKVDGARWARERWRKPSMIDAAVDLRHGRAAHLDACEVDEFLDHVERVLARAA